MDAINEYHKNLVNSGLKVQFNGATSETTNLFSQVFDRTCVRKDMVSNLFALVARIDFAFSVIRSNCALNLSILEFWNCELLEALRGRIVPLIISGLPLIPSKRWRDHMLRDPELLHTHYRQLHDRKNESAQI